MKKNNQKIDSNKYLIGVDGGGTKTVAALSDLKGKISKIGKSGSSHPRNLGLKKAMENVVKAISQILKDKKNAKILSTFIGLPAVAEEFKFRKREIIRKLKKYKAVSKIFEGKVKIGSDQEVAFRAGVDGDGVMLNTGTGCVAHGWKGKKEIHVSGWGYLADEGGAFFVGQKTFQVILKNLDGRGSKTLLTKLTFKKLKLKREEDFLNVVYQNPTEIVPLLSVFCDEASQKDDKIAKKIIIEAAKESTLAAKTAIKKLKFQKNRFPLVLVGSMFKSKIFLEKVKKGIKKFAPKINFILLKEKPVIGAVKLAIENLKR